LSTSKRITSYQIIVGGETTPCRLLSAQYWVRLLKKVLGQYQYHPIPASISQYPIPQYRYCSNPSIDQGVALPPSASCLHGSHAVDVVAHNGRGIFSYPSHGMPSTLQWGYCSLVCNANDIIWCDRRPDYVARFINLMPSLQACHAAACLY